MFMVTLHNNYKTITNTRRRIRSNVLHAKASDTRHHTTATKLDASSTKSII